MPYTGISEHLPTGSREVPPHGLALAYDMSTLTPAGTLRDFSGNGNDGRIVGTEVVPGPVGPARAFRRSADYIALPFERSIHIRGPVSVGVWVRFERLGVHQHLVSFDNLYTLWIDDRDRLRFSDTRGNAFESEPGVVSAGSWTSIVGSFSGRKGTPLGPENIAIYVDGRAVPGRVSGTWEPDIPVEGFLGKETHSGQGHLPLCADLAAVLVFRRALASHEAKEFADIPSLREVTVSVKGGGGSRHADTEPRKEESFPRNRGVRPEAPGRAAGPSESDSRGSASSSHALGWRGNGGTVVLPRVVRISSILAPYRMRTLDLLQGAGSVRFEQWLMARGEKNRRWNVPWSAPNVRIFRDWGIDLTHRDMVSVHFNPGMLWALSARPPDFVILGGYEQPTCLSAGMLLSRLGIPFLVSSEAIALRDSLVGRRAPALVRKLLRRCAGVIVPGRASRDHFLELGVPPDRIFVAPNVVDVERFRPGSSAEKGDARKALSLPDKTLFLTVGRLTPTKGVDDLLDAWALLCARAKDAHLAIVGDGLLGPAVRKRVAEDPALRESVSLVGYAPEDALPLYYRAADAFVFPTHRDIWGLVLNEALSAGLPVVTTDGAAAAADLVDHGTNGFVVPHGDPKALAAALAMLVSDPALRRRMGAAARARILSGFTPRHQATEILNAVGVTMGRLGRPGPVGTAVGAAG